MPFHIIRNDITKVTADAIVNTANPHPTYGSGTDKAIYEAAGANLLLQARQKIGDIKPGDAKETDAYNLNAKYIIHTVGPAWNGGNDGEFDTLKACYENSLDLALKLKCESIAFPLIATGIYGFPRDKALQIAMSAIQKCVIENDIDVTLVVFDKKSFELSGNVVDNIREYVDSNYVKETEEAEYYHSCYEERAEFCCAEEAEVYYAREERCVEERREVPERTNRLKDRLFGNKKGKSGSSFNSAMAPLMMPMAERESTKPKVKIDDLLASKEKTFQEKLFEIIDSRGLTGPQVYNTYISKQVYSKIQSDKYYHPNKYTAIALCLSLHLGVEETQDLIGRAGWTLSPSNKMDLVVKGCIINNEFNKMNIDMILFDFDCPELEKIK